MADRVYTMCETVTIAAGLFSFYDFNIAANNRELKIRSVTLDWHLINNTTGKVVPFEANTDVNLYLEIGSNVTGDNFSTPYTQTLGMPFTYRGNMFVISKPGQLLFNSFVVRNILPFRLRITNTSAASAYMSFVSIITEIEEKIIWEGPQAEPQYSITD